MPEADHRRHLGRGDRRRRGHRRGLRHADRRGQCTDRLPHRQDPGELPVHARRIPAGSAALIGPARVIDLIYTARLVEAEEARAIGLVSEILPDHAALQARAEALARTIAGHAPLTMRATKEAMRRLRLAARQVNGDDLVTLCFTSNDFRQGVESFLARKPAVWTGT